MGEKTGVWIFGAKGGLAVTVLVGSRAIADELTSSSGLVTESEAMRRLGFVSMDDLVFGGHDVR